MLITLNYENIKKPFLKLTFNVYFYSLGTSIYPELRVRGKQMWKALSRGFKHCKSFDPKKDIPKGFEKFNK